jgi:hypothetical protein
MRYLGDLDVKMNLAAGRDVEQLLPERYEMNQLIIRYISLERNRSNGWTTRLCEVFDNGNPDFIDIYEFEAVDPDFPFGEEWIFDSIEGAITFAKENFGAASDRYVNRGLIQDEYKGRYHPDW